MKGVAMTHTQDQDKFYDTAQAADYLDFSKSSLDTWRTQNEGPPFYRFKRRIRYKKSDLDAYLEMQRVETRMPRAS